MSGAARFNEAAAYNCGNPSGSNRPIRCAALRFNEAAAYNCGNPHSFRAAGSSLAGASMRPQHITAETGARPSSSFSAASSFNEAAAYNCGNLDEIFRCDKLTGSFNEAAAYNCGNHDRQAIGRNRSRRFNEAAAYNCGNPDLLPARVVRPVELQ